MKNSKTQKEQISKGSGAPSARRTLLELCVLAFGIFLGFGALALEIFNP
jgi:hypothetical protein